MGVLVRGPEGFQVNSRARTAGVRLDFLLDEEMDVSVDVLIERIVFDFFLEAIARRR